ncbi:MAG: hypothetical protein J0I08_11260 [Rhizobiales bacterium]|nr:hypothetical protein [Hyphomicrobiales bacterium]
MDMATLTLTWDEGLKTPYSIIANSDTYAVANWTVVPGSAEYGSDFTVSALSGLNVVVNPGSSLNIDFNIIDDNIPEDREFFTFHIEVAAYDLATGQPVPDFYINDDYMIVIKDNDAACFIDLDGDNSPDPVELTLGDISHHMAESLENLKNTRDQLNLAVQLLDAQQDQLDALRDLARLGVADAVVSALSLGASNLGKVLSRDVPKFVEALTALTTLYSGASADDDRQKIFALISATAGLAEGTIKGLPIIGLLANTYQQFKNLEEIAQDTVDVVARIRETKATIVDLDTRFGHIMSDMDKLSSCYQGGLHAQSVEDGGAFIALQAITSPSNLFLTSVSGNETVVNQLGLKLIAGTDGGDSIEMPTGFLNVLPIVVVNAGDGNDTIHASPVMNGGDQLWVIGGGGGRDTLVLDRPSTDFAYFVTSDGTVTLTPFVMAGYNHNYGGTQTLLESVERVIFTDKTIIVDTDGSFAGDAPLFDSHYYLGTYADVFDAGANANSHYQNFGWHEGRNPDAFFSTTGYLAANGDVGAANVNPLIHYDVSGWKEGRDPSVNFDTSLYLEHNPDVAAAGIDPLAHYLEFGKAEGRQTYTAVGQSGSFTHGSFDAEFYLLNNVDVAKAAIASGGNTLEFAYNHYEQFGWHEGRNPNSLFDVNGYLDAHADVRAAGVDPLAHYDDFGWKEGRDPSGAFDTKSYLSNYADVAAAQVDPLQHYLAFGIHEGRSSFLDGVIA